MKKIISLLFTFIIFFSFLSISNVSSDIFRDDKTEIPYCEGSDCGLEKGVSYVKDAGINGIITEGTASEYIQRIIVYLLYFLKLVAVIIIIYAGFNMLTAAGDDEKFKKSKTMVMYAIIGLAIIYLAGPITSFIIDIFVKS